MQTARDLMTPALIVSPETALHDLAQLLLDNGADGACVTEHGQLVGVITAMDLVFTQRVVQGPTTFTLFELVVAIGQARAEREFLRTTASHVEQLMTREVVSVTPDTPVGELAARMVDQHLTVLPVVSADEGLLGVVTKAGLVRHVLEHTATWRASS